MTNPLLSNSGLPDFAGLDPEHVAPAIGELLDRAEAALARSTSADVAADYDAIAAVLGVALERLSRAWGLVSHLSHVADTPALRAAYNEMLPRVSDFFARTGADAALFAKYRAIDADAPGLDRAKRKALSNALRDFKLSGAQLQGQSRQRYLQIEEELARLSQQFSEHVLDATDAFHYFASEAEIAGIPAEILAAAAQRAAQDGRAGYKLTLQLPCWLPVMQYARDRGLRERLYRAYQARASDLGDPVLDNSALIESILGLRQERAKLLGYDSHAQVSVVPKMAQSPEQVITFLLDLAQRVKPAAQREWAQLKDFAARDLALPDMQAWDQHLVAEKLRESLYAFSEQEVKQYFNFPQVLAGLFAIIEKLFDVRIREDSAPVWHESVRFYRIERPGLPNPLLAQFYLDPYAREGKRPGAWMDEMRGRWARPDRRGSVQTPVAHLVCNFAAPVGAQPSLLTHDDVITLFHEFGHGLHHMLTQVDELAVAGISGVEWDAVELPSQFMENFCWEWPVLERLSAHAQTGAPMPRELFDKMLAARNFHSALETLRQIEYALFDMRVHAEPGAAARTAEVLVEVRAQVAVAEVPAFRRLAHTFAHVFSGGYAAGYYSYKWAEVLSADAYSAFEEAGVFDRATGQRWQREVLEAGGSRPALESFIAFRGREPSIDALLRHQGIA